MSETPEMRALALEWIDGDMPYSPEFGDHFYCREDGRAECGHVFLAGNGLPDRWTAGGTFTIGELGFGTGLNFCETWRVWESAQQAGGVRGPIVGGNGGGSADSLFSPAGEKREPAARSDRNSFLDSKHPEAAPSLHFVSFELHPMDRASIGKALSRWPALDPQRQALTARWPERPEGIIDLDFGGGVRLTVVCGDALTNLTASGLAMDAWYLDGFAPSRNPALWSEAMLRAVHDHTKPGGRFATYAAAGFVRRNLVAAGFAVERRPGFAGKREMLCGERPASP